jgi:hypothetical protein
MGAGSLHPALESNARAPTRFLTRQGRLSPVLFLIGTLFSVDLDIRHRARDALFNAHCRDRRGLDVSRSLPEVPEAIGGHFGVAHRMLNVFMSEIVL